MSSGHRVYAEQCFVINKPERYCIAQDDKKRGKKSPKTHYFKKIKELPAMQTTYSVPLNQSRAASQTGIARVLGEIAALIDGTVAVFTEAFDLSSAARARFPSAD
jgi:hypothetical protein